MITIKEASVFIGHHPVSRNLRLLQARRVPHSILPRGAIHRGAVARARPRLPSFSRPSVPPSLPPSLARSLARSLAHSHHHRNRFAHVIPPRNLDEADEL